MDLITTVTLFLLGLLLIVKGGDLFVDAATWIAEAFGIPKFIVGATIVSLATTLPELIVSVIATAQGSLGLAVGNAVGSVNGNIGLILGISLVCMPTVMKRSEFAFKGILMIASACLLFFACLSGYLHLPGALLLLLVVGCFTFLNIREAKAGMLQEATAISTTRDRSNKGKMIAKFLGGLVGIVVGAQLLVDHGCDLARLLGVPETVIGVTLVAIGTSLPELVTTIVAIRRKEAALSIGNIIGANIIDLTIILPICTLIAEGSLSVPVQTLQWDLPVCIALCLMAIVPAMVGERFRRMQGVVLLIGYAAYIAVLILVPMA